MDLDYGVVLASPPEVRNVVASGTTGYQIDLAKLSQMDRQASWEPELFCGLKFTLCANVTALVFATGKIVFVGGKGKSAIKNACAMLLPYVDSARLVLC